MYLFTTAPPSQDSRDLPPTTDDDSILGGRRLIAQSGQKESEGGTCSQQEYLHASSVRNQIPLQFLKHRM